MTVQPLDKGGSFAVSFQLPIIHYLKSKAMKRVIFLIGVMLLMAGAAKAQDEKVRMGAERQRAPADSETKVKLRLHYPFMAPRAHPPR